MTVLTCASTGKSITLLGEPIANSGEGKVWRTNHNGYLAKIYHLQSPERVQKLAVMIAHRPKEPNSHPNHISFAWPKSVLKDAQGDCVGFLMPEIKEGKELINVYNYQKRKALKLDVDWRFLHTTALNIASIIEAIHISGYVLGDIKQQNILVNDRALPSIIDTDSFQVRNPVNGKIYRCPVGSPDYTPPELIDKNFSSIDQTEVHDRFRLAVIIYQLLFGGQTPFAGKWIGAGETPQTNELIHQGLWLYAPNRLMQPVERTIPLEIIHPEVQRCFLRCFNDSYKNPNLRPTAGDWVKALRLAVNELTICGKVDSHYYSRTYGKCYWCDHSTKLGIDIFPGFARPKQAAFAESISQPNQYLNSSSQVSQLAASIPQTQLAKIQLPKTKLSVNKTKLRKVLLVSAIVVLMGTQIYGYVRYGLFPTNPIFVIASLSSSIFLERTLTRHSDCVNSVAFSPDGQILASASSDRTIKLWNVTTGKLLQSLLGHSNSVNSVAFSPDGQTLASASSDGTIKLWNVTTGKLLQSLLGHSNSVNSVAFSPDGQTLASGGSYDGTIKLWNVTTGTLLQIFPGHFHWVNSVAFSPDGQTLANGSHDGTIKLWNVTRGTLLKTISGHSDSVNSVAFSPDGQTLASGGSYDGTIKLWNVTTGTLLQILQGHSNLVNSVVFNPDGKTLASGSYDKTIKLWNVTTAREIQTLPGDYNLVNSVAFSPSGQILTSGSSDGTIKIWRIW
ncbi:protein kinase domain-containing protein [Nostoc sp.]|uniref:WD40 domain-containing protein n=1 Tax=Nostoc sp. TaxID=1180 RepID=UPI002FF48EEE